MSAAGYSATPLARKLAIKPGHRLLVLSAPPGFVLDDLPAGVRIGRTLRGPADVIVSFHTRRARLEARLGRLQAAMEQDASLWIAWPKRASKVPTDLTEDAIRGLALAGTLVDTKVCAIDAVWSGLRLVIRVEHRT